MSSLLLQVKRVNVFFIDLEKKEVQVPTVVRISDGSRMNCTAIYELTNQRKLEKLAAYTELVIITLMPTKTVFIYGKNRKETNGSVPVADAISK